LVGKLLCTRICATLDCNCYSQTSAKDSLVLLKMSILWTSRRTVSSSKCHFGL